MDESPIDIEHLAKILDENVLDEELLQKLENLIETIREVEQEHQTLLQVWEVRLNGR